MSRLKTYSRCKICNEHLVINTNNMFKDIFADTLLLLKVHKHYKKEHDKQYLSKKGLLRQYITILILLTFVIPFAMLFLITYPFWWIHEKMFG